ncbi:Josephin-like protein [Quillaja saponaria]|uniref:ubiquitinyl hydrolase 1 n=1 Tax=Quillaja saponaria TaxID=32244 RepID=A0AAD7PR80_QUISA|nr:Josephin-like protein [Quillaja saponaria]
MNIFALSLWEDPKQKWTMLLENSRIYRERQRLQCCLLYSHNILFQQKNSFTRARLNAICEKLVLDEPNNENWTPLALLFNPQHNALTGNCDINVLIVALEENGKEVVWHDRRNGSSSIDLDAPEDTLMGIVLKIYVRSDLDAPQSFKDTDEVRAFLDYIIGLGGEVLLVMNQKQS